MSANNRKFIDLNLLPKNVFTKIALYLTSRDIRVLSTTSKLFKNLIDQDPVILCKMPLQLNVNNVTNLKDAKKQLTRCYSSVNVYTEKFIKTTALWLTSSFCAKLRILTFSYMEFHTRDAKLLQKTFQSLHDLEDLTMIKCTFHGYTSSMESAIKAVSMPSLKLLKLSSSHVAFLLFMKAPELRKLEIIGQGDSEPSSLITSFLTRDLLKLRHLALHNITFQGNIAKEQIESIKLTSLHSLSLSRLNKPFQNNENLQSFMELIIDTLEELNVGVFNKKLPDTFYALIISRLQKLKTLSLHLADIPTCSEFYNCFRGNTSIKTLIIKDDTIKYKKALTGLLAKLPSLERMIISSASIGKAVLQIISSNCQNLKTLECFEIDNFEKSLSLIIMPTVTKLSICHFYAKSHKVWSQIVLAFPNIETLSLHVIDGNSLNERAFKIFTKELKTIKNFVFGTGFKATERIFEIMIANCNNLQSVEVIQSSAFHSEPELCDEIKARFVELGLRFICYNERNVCSLFDAQGISKYVLADPPNEDDEEEDDDEPAVLFNALLLLRNFVQLNNRHQDNNNNNQNQNNDAEIQAEASQEEINYQELD